MKSKEALNRPRSHKLPADSRVQAMPIAPTSRMFIPRCRHHVFRRVLTCLPPKEVGPSAEWRSETDAHRLAGRGQQASRFGPQERRPLAVAVGQRLDANVAQHPFGGLETHDS